MKNELPIRKVAVGAVAAFLTWVAQQLGIFDTTILGIALDSSAIQAASPWIIGYLVSYLVRDPRVMDVLDETDLLDDGPLPE